jgi:hypothetical protein
MAPNNENHENTPPANDLSVPARVSTDDAQLGELDAVFEPMSANIVAGFIISLLLIVGGLSAIGFSLHAAHVAGWKLPTNAERGWSWINVGLATLLGVALITGGLVLGRFARGLMSHRVEVFAKGFRYCSRGSAEPVLWTNIGGIRETILYERPPILKGPAKLLLPKVASFRYLVVTNRGKEYSFDGNSIKSIERFGNILRAQAERLSLPFETVEEHYCFIDDANRRYFFFRLS